MRIKVLPVLMLLSISCLYARENTNREARYIDSLMRTAYKEGAPGAVVLAARNGKIILHKAYGLADLEKKRPLTTENIFPLGSIIKQFTAVGILQLAGKGKLSLKDDIKKYLPDFSTRGRMITIENLLTHTSGLKSLYERPDYSELKKSSITRDEAVSLIESDSLYFEPGSQWNYSNSGFTLAGLIIEKISGMDLASYFKKNIFGPLGMKRTYLLTNKSQRENIPPYYKALSDSQYQAGPDFNWNLFFAAGDLASCTEDMMKWDEALYTGKLLSRKILSHAWDNHLLPEGVKTNYGYGWSLDEYKGNKIIWHDGIMGYLSDAVRLPEKHVFVIIMSNNGSVSPNETAEQAALFLSGNSAVPQAKQLAEDVKLSEYTGHYEIQRPAGNDYKNKTDVKQYRIITEENGKLYAQRSGRNKYELSYAGKDLFFFTGTNTYIKFERGTDGKIARLVFYNEPVNYGPDSIEIRTTSPLSP